MPVAPPPAHDAVHADEADPLHLDHGGGPPWHSDGEGGGGDGGGGDDDSRDEDPEPIQWVTLATFMHPAEAHIARLRLESAGVVCVLLDELTAGTHCLSLAVGGVKLQVPHVDRDRAVTLLRRLVDESNRTPKTITLAVLPDAKTAKMAVCVLEAADVEAVAIDGAALRVDADDLSRAASLLAAGPFAAALSHDAVASLATVPCPDCGERASRLDARRWRSVIERVRAAPRPDLHVGSWARRILIALLAARRCRACGRRW